MLFSWIKTTPLLLLILLVCAYINAQDKKEYYQLKTYTVKNKMQEQLVDTYLEKAFLPTLKRYGLNSVGVFKLHNDAFVKADKIYVFIPFTSLLQFEALEDFLLKDKAHLTDGEPYLQAAHNKAPYERINSVLMRAFTGMPKMIPVKIEGPRAMRVYELRSYESPTEVTYKNKVHMFNQGGEVALFNSLGFNAVFYAEVISGNAMPNLMYMTTFSNMDKRDELWKGFFSSDKWKALKEDDYYKNNMNKADIMLLYPTEYSDY
ncbi:NIPSNAP family protein [Maribacter antarcticus]|uniref:NIPSNAP family protein n=1 Tax=Maribacter antarcticus TaxID=505250 RepID=UPI0004787930|nr:NIPSNAP family protein [Maribacter antarcticus]